MSQENTFEPQAASSFALREKPYTTKAGKTGKGLALLIGDQKIDYFGRFGGWDKWLALGQLFTRLSENPAEAKALGAAIQKQWIANAAKTNASPDLGDSLVASE